MVIDDLANRPLDADLVLNQNLGEHAIDYAAFVAGDTALLIGPSFALLRPQFAAARHRFGRVRTSVRRLLVFMGGSDAPDVTSFVANALRDVGLPVDIVTGGQYPHGRHLDATVADRKNFAVHRNVADMTPLMLRADLAIGAPGSASWERCCLGLPTVMLTVADNQIRAGAALEAVGAAVNLGWHAEVDTTRLVLAIRQASDHDRIVAMSIAASAVTDGEGTKRVADAIEAVTTGGEKHG
jgi:UDP-2,4-diacetamido-2,4,6-trideoxy-beta-L-altropyranose hydrolase